MNYIPKTLTVTLEPD